MARPAEEVLRSQRSMLERDGKAGGQVEDAAIARTFGAQLQAVARYCAQQAEVELLPVSYAEAVASPGSIAKAVAAFLAESLDVAAMAAAVDPNLYREKAS